ncbi:MAG: hypothetical protein HWN67_23550 [Candidatus Helarchaeota archaeon]|nr:hypothetical protein [Candidatus Helarchaeota archaeon]
MSKKEEKIQRGEDYITMKWAILAITGLGIIVIGLIIIFTRDILYNANVDDFAFLIYIISDYFNIKFGYPFLELFFVLSILTSNYFLEIMTKQLYFGLIICANGEILSILGFIRVHQLNKHYWSELLDKFEI